MKNNNNDINNKENDDHSTSVGTPLGHVSIDKEIFNQSFIGWIKNVFDREKNKDENEDKIE